MINAYTIYVQPCHDHKSYKHLFAVAMFNCRQLLH